MELEFVKEYFGAMVSGVPLLLVVMGLVEWFKAQGVTGKTLGLVSMAVGLILGGGFMITQTRPPVGDWWTSYVYWFGVIVYGIGLGIVASGLYDIVKKLLSPKTPPTSFTLKNGAE
jgi:drug/metabolite transporter (DMT)-like permease